MRNLLVCTDFSDPASHAASYAAMLASQYKLPGLTLFHAYQSFVTSTALPLNPDEDQERAKAVYNQLQESKKHLETFVGEETKILIRAEKLSLGENINQLCEEENADMIVMGVSGKSRLQRGLIGSNTINVSQNSQYPVCIVPAGASIKPVTHVMLACDLDELQRSAGVNRLDETLRFLNATLTVINVSGKKNRHFSPQTNEYPMLQILKKYNPRYETVENNDIVEGILDCAREKNISIVLAIPKNYNFLQQIIHRSATQQLIYQSTIPILTLHE